MEKEFYAYINEENNEITTLKLTKQEAQNIIWFLNKFFDGYGVRLFKLDEEALEIDVD